MKIHTSSIHSSQFILYKYYTQKQNHQRKSYGTRTLIETFNNAHQDNHPLTPYVKHGVTEVHSIKYNHLSRNNRNFDNIIQSKNPSQNTKNTPSTDPSANTNFKILFLGTSGGGRASSLRNPTSTLLRLGGKSILIDAGEGVQKQLSLTHVNVGTIEKILITHMHADHVVGLLPLILQINIAKKDSVQMMKDRRMGKQKNQRFNNNKNKDNQKYEPQDINDLPTLEIFGPPGIYNYIAMNLKLTFSKLHYVRLIITELDGGIACPKSQMYKKPSSSKVLSGKPSSTFSNNYNDPIMKAYPELNHPNITKRSLQKNKQGIWEIESLPTITKEMVENAVDRRSKRYHDSIKKKGNEKSSCILPNERQTNLSIQAAEVQHNKNVQTYGYAIQECPPQLNIDVDKAIKAGVKPGPNYRFLKNGFEVMSDDGSKVIYPQDVCKIEEEEEETMDEGEKFDENSSHEGGDHLPKKNFGGTSGSRLPKARKLVSIGDTCRVSREMIQIAQDADVLIHEATLDQGAEDVAFRRGHSTAKMAGFVAKLTNTKVLLLNHIGSPSTVKSVDEFFQQSPVRTFLNRLVRSAEENCRGISQVATAYDFMEVSVPRAGFQFDDDNRRKQDNENVHKNH